MRLTPHRHEVATWGGRSMRNSGESECRDRPPEDSGIGCPIRGPSRVSRRSFTFKNLSAKSAKFLSDRRKRADDRQVSGTVHHKLSLDRTIRPARRNLAQQSAGSWPADPLALFAQFATGARTSILRILRMRFPSSLGRPLAEPHPQSNPGPGTHQWTDPAGRRA